MGMRLSDWLNKPGNTLTQDALGAKVGVTQGRISQIARNGTRDFLMIRKLSAATNYEVSPDELLPPERMSAASGDAA